MRKTEREYWDEGYDRTDAIVPVQIDPPLNWTDKLFYDLFSSLDLAGKDVVEIGGGGSAWLGRLALDYPGADFTSLDYSPSGCELVRRFAEKHGLDNVHAIEGDLFDKPPAGMEFDVAYSFGVVEHFERLEEALSAIAAFLRPQGRMLTVIPNMAGSLGALVRRYNKAVYDIHVPHDLASFLDGHRRAGLKVERGGYLGSNNFGVISSCFSSPSDPGYSTYLWLSRFTKGVDLIERRVGSLPASRAFSPYIYAIASAN